MHFAFNHEASSVMQYSRELHPSRPTRQTWSAQLVVDACSRNSTQSMPLLIGFEIKQIDVLQFSHPNCSVFHQTQSWAISCTCEACGERYLAVARKYAAISDERC